MKNLFFRLTSLLLCAVMVFAMLPAAAMPAEAAEVKTGLRWVGHENGLSQFKEVKVSDYKATDVPVADVDSAAPAPAPSADKAIEQYGNYYRFSNFAELKELASRTYSECVNLEYEGSEDLVISQNLTLPENAVLLCRQGKKLIVNSGVTFSVNGDDYVEVDLLEINGTMNSRSILNVYDEITVSGSLIMNKTLYLRNGARLTGRNKIKMNSGKIYHRWDVHSTAEVVAAIVEANAASDDIPHDISLGTNQDVVIDEAISIPANASMQVWGEGTVTFAKDITVEEESCFDCYGKAVICGDLVNYSLVRVQGPGTMTFDGGSYSGPGVMWAVPNNGESKYTQLVKGLDATNLEVVKVYGRWHIRDVRGLPALGAPKSLKWNKGIDWSGSTPKISTFVGWLTWAAAAPREKGNSWYLLKIYRDNTLVAENMFNYGEEYFDSTRYIDAFFGTMMEMKSGTYHFTVQAIATGTGYRNSQVVKSEKWTYTKPSSKYSRPTKLSWDWPLMKWSGPKNHDFYQLRIYYSATKNGKPALISDGWNYGGGKVEYPWIWQCGPGYYSFQVRTLSENINKRWHSSWSEMSPAYRYTGKEKPDAPKVKITGSTASGRNVVKWSHVPGADRYRIYRATSKSGTYKLQATVDGDVLKYVDKTATPGKNYYYKVRAMSFADVYSSWSNVVNRVADLAQPKVTISRTSGGNPRLKWKKIAGAEKYRVYRATSKNGEYKLMKTTVSATSFTDKTAKAGKVYYYKVRAIDTNSSGNSAYSAVKHIRAK